MPVNAMNTPWNPEREALLVSLVGGPFSCKWLAAEINKRTGSVFTRNSIISKIHRMGLVKNDPLVIERQERPKKPRDGRKLRKTSDRTTVVDLFADTLPPPDFLGVPWLEAVNSKTCMYPEGAGQHMLFCGQPRKDESSYCPGHHAICWVKPTGKRTVKWKLWGAAACA